MPDTIFALATPAHPSPVALIRVSGAATATVARALCDAPMKRASIECEVELSVGSVPAVAWVLPAPGTLTGEDTLELRIPGNMEIVRQLEESLRELGCRDAEPGEFTRRALDAGKLDLAKAEAVLQLINAGDEVARRQAVADLSGETTTVVAALGERLRAISARFEMSFDFSEEEHADAEVASLMEDLTQLVSELAKVVGSGESRPHRAHPVVALFGPPNAGKSTLYNALLGVNRSLVSETPGTTRDPVEAECALGTHTVLLVDLSGVGELDADRGRFAGCARDRALQSDVLLVLEAPDAERPLSEFAALEKQDAGLRSRALWIRTKRDLGEGPALSHGIESVDISAISGGGLNELRARLIERLDRIASGGATSLLRVRSREALTLLQNAVQESAPPEVAASDVRRALKLLDQALLSETPGEVLDLIFSRFCIGK